MTRMSSFSCLSAYLVVGALAALPPAYVSAEPLQSPRLERAKDLIAEEQWARAIEVLRAAAADPRERNQDEALFWLAHSQHQGRDSWAAIQTISTLEARFPKSRWVKPARSLRVEIAQKLGRHDVLWLTAQPQGVTPAPLAPPAGVAPTRETTPSRAAAPASGSTTSPQPERPGRVTRTPPSGTATTSTPRGAPPREYPVTVTMTPAPSTLWIPEGWNPDMNLRIQALGSLMQTDAPKVMPILKEIALESPDPEEARRAVFVLAQSGRPEAHSVVMEVARQGTELVQIAAVRELGRFGGEKVAEELLKVYSIGNPRVKYQVVNSLGERSATTALLRIAETESDRRLQETALVRLGQAGASEQLWRFYTRARTELKRPIINGLFNARAEDELIHIIEQEKDPQIRQEALARLKLLDSAKARAVVEREAQRRKK